MLLTIILSIVVCVAVSLMMVSGIAFAQEMWMFSSAPNEAKAVLIPRNKELFKGTKTLGWVLMAFSHLMILGSLVIALWDGFRSGFTFWQLFGRILMMFTIYKAYDMIFFDYLLLLKFRFFQHYFPECEHALDGKKYGFNVKSQLMKLLVIFPAVAALTAWICTLF